jgi:sigma-B regulation protein RsbU (phosphoserine phosphatase)
MHPAPQPPISQHIASLPILIVDDNEINRIFIEKTLQKRGFTNLLCVDSGEEALVRLVDFSPDLVILDILMPGISGFDCCRIIRSDPRYRNLPILIQTTLSEPELRVRAFEMGATDFVSKPIYPDELCARVTVHLEKQHSLQALQHYKNRIELELDSARQLQQAIFPGVRELQELEQSCRLSIASYFQPSSEIGGDFWGIKNLFPQQVSLWLVDFSGHGVAAALNSFRLQAHLKEHSPLAARPGEYLSHLNDKLLQLLLRGQFATMFYGILDLQGDQLFYACACAPHPIILRKTGKAELIDGSGKPLGIGMHLYQTQSIPFAEGDTLLLYSDALTETPNHAGDYITEQQIMELLEQHPNATAASMKEALMDLFKHHARESLDDDLTIAICRRAPR